MHTIGAGVPEISEQRQRRAARPPIPQDDIASLVGAAVNGEQRAWNMLVLRYGAGIRAVARRHRLSEPDQDEVAQRTWLCLFEHIESVREPAAIGGWLATTARHECLRILRASRREIPVDAPSPAEPPQSNPVEDAVVEAERRAALHQAVDALPDRQRTLMRTLLREPTLSFDDVSVVLDMPRGSLGPTHGRCLTRLRQNSDLARVVGAAGSPAAA
jgi:RNA polymerase sigma factor (sigma-70 family)